jgi:hypothetical protein
MRLVRHRKRLADGTRLGTAWPALCALVAILAAACSSGAGSAANTAAPAASSAKLKVTSTLDGLAALPHRIHWQAFPRPSADVTEVDFLIDGKQLWVEHNSPYFYGDDGNYLVPRPRSAYLRGAGDRRQRVCRHRHP